jgi:hypothetical protein
MWLKAHRLLYHSADCSLRRRVTELETILFLGSNLPAPLQQCHTPIALGVGT